MQETTYGVTSLAMDEAVPARLLQVGRAHWGIEDGLHYRRDETLQEDRCRLKGRGAHAIVVLDNLVRGPLRRCGHENMPDARRYCAANLREAVALVLWSPA